jgi:hypothetical protein
LLGKGEFGKMCMLRNICGSVRGVGSLTRLWACLLLCGLSLPVLAQSPPLATAAKREAGAPDDRRSSVSGGQQADGRSSGYISGRISAQAGAVAVEAQVQLVREDQSPIKEIVSDASGQFFFADLPPGPFQLTVTAEGFHSQQVSGVMHPGEAYIVPEIRLALATVVTEVEVKLTPVEVAQDQIKEQEKQRVLGFIPNFYVSYVPNAAPLAAKQKFELAWKSTIDPFTFVGVAAIAGFQQATDDFAGYGQGMQGYAKRFGAAYADVVAGTYIGSAILPSLLKQDPRYFYKGTGSARSRLLYSVGNTVICKGDNSRWQPNYSGILGTFASSGISYLYYPASDRDGTGFILQNSLIRFGETAFTNVLQEFIVRKFTPHLQRHPPAEPQ